MAENSKINRPAGFGDPAGKNDYGTSRLFLMGPVSFLTQYVVVEVFYNTFYSAFFFTKFGTFVNFGQHAGSFPSAYPSMIPKRF
jgi:hypothetical protein